jgi:chemotaxis protein MotC
MKARPLVNALVLLTLGVGACAPASAQTISALAADLQALQAQIASGDQSAYAAQPERLKAIGAAIAAAKPEVWQSKTETDAAVIYLLSGGQPRDLVQLLQSGAVPKSEVSLMRGAIAYIVGNETEAKALLGDFDPRKLDLRLAGQVAFAQSVIETSRDEKKAIALLDLARLLAPGGLVEEAALRREVSLVGDQRDIDRFVALSRQYATRFGRSVYADNFLQGLAAAVLQASLIEDVPSFQKFRALASSLTPDIRRGFLLTIARAEALNGKFAIAGLASSEALRAAPSDSPDEARGRLYEAAARILTPEYDDGVAELQSVAPSKLDKRDQALLGAVRGVAAYLREPPGDIDPGHEQASPPPPPQGGSDRAAATIALAEAAISRTAALATVAEKGDL